MSGKSRKMLMITITIIQSGNIGKQGMEEKNKTLRRPIRKLNGKNLLTINKFQPFRNS